MLELHAVRGGVEAEAGIAGDEHVAGRQHLRALAPHDDVVTCEEGFYYSWLRYCSFIGSRGQCYNSDYRSSKPSLLCIKFGVNSKESGLRKS